MKPRISVLTLAVQDLEKAVAFYRDGLGWETEGIVGKELENGAVAFFDLQGGLKLALWPQTSLVADTTLDNSTPNKNTMFTIGHLVNSKEEVDTAFNKAVEAGAKTVLVPENKNWGGYAGYFQDLDGHVWEIVWNPAIHVED